MKTLIKSENEVLMNAAKQGKPHIEFKKITDITANLAFILNLLQITEKSKSVLTIIIIKTINNDSIITTQKKVEEKLEKEKTKFFNMISPSFPIDIMISAESIKQTATKNGNRNGNGQFSCTFEITFTRVEEEDKKK